MRLDRRRTQLPLLSNLLILLLMDILMDIHVPECSNRLDIASSNPCILVMNMNPGMFCSDEHQSTKVVVNLSSFIESSSRRECGVTIRNNRRHIPKKE
jgi:hypothetical protein